MGKVLCWGLLVILPVGGFAAPGPEMRSYLLSVGHLYEDLEFERALEQLVTARRLSRGIEDDVALSLWEGIILAELSQAEQAAAAFKAALFLQPEARLPVNVSPKLLTQFETLRREVKNSLARRTRAQAVVPALVSGVDAPRQEPVKSSVAEPPPPARPGATDASLARAESPLPRSSEARAERSLRSRAHVPAIIGGALAAAGGVSWALSRGELSKLRSSDPSLGTSPDIERSVSRGRSLQTVGVGLLSAGAVGLGVAAGMYFLGAPTERVSVSVGTDGGTAFVSGRWP
ncbi:hypothetical protein [Pyxidicoccus xibeiensis]|uniref:hypothetical protein n=1 Tax=Pyxidicoccus xibeiensis TaxID=2906759 RepID=UPI0020A6F217|nr:hypothetical protein [Pyxidicoccus xibeiensis]MCP3138489.1 hypothetical protein [Pyxidicoccus xibeiensis]